MPSNLQVILQQDVPKLGQSGDLVRVRPGFARNYLLPRQLAVPATAAAVHRIEHEKAVAVARAEKAKKDARETAGKLAGVTVTIAQKAGEDGRLFGSVTTKDIVAALKAQGHEVDRRKVQLDAPIKATGTYPIHVTLVSDVAATITVEVVAK
jgi:large subunit ribosomal protein L9